MNDPYRTIHAEPGHTVDVAAWGLRINVALNDDGQPTVLISTEDMRPEYVYDEETGLPGTAEPYTHSQDRDEAFVEGPGAIMVSRHYGKTAVAARMAAREHCNMLNESWSTHCGMPDVQVLLNDATIYDSEDHNPALREKRGK